MRRKGVVSPETRRGARQEHEPVRHAETRLKKEAFISAYAQLGIVTSAAKAAGIERKTHYRWLEADAAYRKSVEDAEDQATDRMEQEAWRRAVAGVDKPIYHKGVKVDTIKEWSDLLLIFMLKARRPEKFRERIEHAGPGGGPIQHSLDLSRLSDQELDLWHRLAVKATVGGVEAPGVSAN